MKQMKIAKIDTIDGGFPIELKLELASLAIFILKLFIPFIKNVKWYSDKLREKWVLLPQDDKNDIYIVAPLQQPNNLTLKRNLPPGESIVTIIAILSKYISGELRIIQTEMNMIVFDPPSAYLNK